MRRYLRSSAVNDPVSAWGLYKSDDDQTHFYDLCRDDGRRGDGFARTGAAELSGTARSGLFAVSARSGRLSPWPGRARFRRIGRRGRTERPGFDGAAAAWSGD